MSLSVYRDDMDILLPLYVEVDLVIWSFPIYYFALPSNIIRFQQRMLPIMDSSIVEVEDNRFIQPLRNSEVLDRYEIFFSTGGLPSFENNFESLEMYVTLLKGEKGQKIFLPQSESIHKPYMEKKASRLKKLIYESGKSFHLDTGIDKKWLQKLSKPLMEPDYYTKIANQYLVK